MVVNQVSPSRSSRKSCTPSAVSQAEDCLHRAGTTHNDRQHRGVCDRARCARWLLRRHDNLLRVACVRHGRGQLEFSQPSDAHRLNAFCRCSFFPAPLPDRIARWPRRPHGHSLKPATGDDPRSVAWANSVFAQNLSANRTPYSREHKLERSKIGPESSPPRRSQNSTGAAVTQPETKKSGRGTGILDSNAEVRGAPKVSRYDINRGPRAAAAARWILMTRTGMIATLVDTLPKAARVRQYVRRPGHRGCPSHRGRGDAPAGDPPHGHGWGVHIPPGGRGRPQGRRVDLAHGRHRLRRRRAADRGRQRAALAPRDRRAPGVAVDPDPAGPLTDDGARRTTHAGLDARIGRRRSRACCPVCSASEAGSSSSPRWPGCSACR